jgi:hypothetical protein
VTLWSSSFVCMPSNCRMMPKIICLSRSSRRRLLWAVALPVSSLKISIASRPMMGGFLPRRKSTRVVVLAEAFGVHLVRGEVGDRTANAMESTLRQTGCSKSVLT